MMRWLKTFWRKLLNSPSGERHRHRYTLQHAIELPDQPKSNVLYAIGEGEAWSAAMLCPCGCTAIIQLSLLEDDQPRWELSIDKKRRPTLYPSIWRTMGCKSHFILRAGEVLWCQKVIQAFH